MSDSVRPHRRWPTRLLCPWDFPGKNTGVGCHFLLQCMKVKSESEVAQSCPTPATPWTATHQAPPSMGFSRQNYWSGVPLPPPTPPFWQPLICSLYLWFCFCFIERFICITHQFSSVTQLCPFLCDPMDCNMQGFPVHHQLPKFTQTHVHGVSDAIQPSHPLSSPSPPDLILWFG